LVTIQAATDADCLSRCWPLDYLED